MMNLDILYDNMIIHDNLLQKHNKEIYEHKINIPIQKKRIQEYIVKIQKYKNEIKEHKVNLQICNKKLQIHKSEIYEHKKEIHIYIYKTNI